MSADESLEKQVKSDSPSVAADAIGWGEKFVQLLELDYTAAAARLPAGATDFEFRSVMLRAVVDTLVESGADPDEIASLFQGQFLPGGDADERVEWSNEMNARRLTLIDKMIQRTLSVEEADELDRLTSVLRPHTETEQLFPVEGVRQLHRRLLNMVNRDDT